MNRYTAVLRCQPETLVELRRSIDRELSRGLFTYRLGEMTERAPGEVLLEVATEVKKGEIVRTLEAAGAKLAFEVERVGWGWLLTRERPPEPLEVRADFVDPLLSVEPQLGGATEYRFRVRPLLLYLVRIFWILASAGLVLASAVQGKDVLWVFITAIWVFILFAPHGSFSRVSSLYLDEDGIEIRYWLPRLLERVRWRDLDGMDLMFPDRACSLRAGPKRRLIALTSLRGDATWLIIARTVVERASLLFVSGVPFGSASYRRFEAE